MTHRPRLSITRSLKHLVSSDVRRALRQDPVLERVDLFVRGLAAGMGTATEARLRRSVTGPRKPEKVRDQAALNTALCAQQLRGVWHSSARAKAAIGYLPPHSFADSMNAFGRWLRAIRGMEEPEWPLIQGPFGYKAVN